MHALTSSAERAPNWLRAVLAIGLPLVAFATAAARGPLTIALFLVWLAAALWAHLPVFRFDGPLPFSSQGVHVSGAVHPWEDVVRVEADGPRDLRAVLRSGDQVRLRVRGARTREQLRQALGAHRPDLIAF